MACALLDLHENISDSLTGIKSISDTSSLVSSRLVASFNF